MSLWAVIMVGDIMLSVAFNLLLALISLCCIFLILVDAQCHHAECHYAECHYAECHYAECNYGESHYAECRF